MVWLAQQMESMVADEMSRRGTQLVMEERPYAAQLYWTL